MKYQVRITFNSPSKRDAEEMLDRMVLAVGEERFSGAVLLRPRPAFNPDAVAAKWPKVKQ